MDAADPTVDTRAPEEGWISGMSDDLQTVYFGAQGVLTADPGPTGALPSTARTTSTSGTPATGSASSPPWRTSTSTARSGDPSGAYVTGNGNFFAFMTEQQPRPGGHGHRGTTPHDVYLYDREANTLTFASPGADQGRGVELPTPTPDSARGRGLSNAVSEDGSHVFLFTADPVVPEDKNLEFDIYEFVNGQVSLVSGGKAEVDNSPTFIGATPNGSDVFFADLGQLVDTDIDGLPDVYDARVGGGFPTPPPGPVSPPEGCREDACQGPAGARPSRPTPGSLTAEPEGDVGNATFRVRSIGAAARRRFARTGRLTLRMQPG